MPDNIVTVIAHIKVKAGLEEQAENWASEEAFKAHAASTEDHRLALRQQLSELVDGPARLTFWRRLG